MKRILLLFEKRASGYYVVNSYGIEWTPVTTLDISEVLSVLSARSLLTASSKLTERNKLELSLNSKDSNASVIIEKRASGYYVVNNYGSSWELVSDEQLPYIVSVICLSTFHNFSSQLIEREYLELSISLSL